MNSKDRAVSWRWGMGWGMPSPETTRRLVRTTGLTQRTSVLELGGSELGLNLAAESGCYVVCVDVDPQRLRALYAQAQQSDLASRWEGEEIEPNSWSPPSDDEFQVVVACGGAWAPIDQLAAHVRDWLSPDGFLCLSSPVRIRQGANSTLLAFWEQVTGRPVPTAAEGLRALRDAGYEPETAESWGDEELAVHYRQLEQFLEGVKGDWTTDFRRELEIYRAHGGAGSGVTFGHWVARRHEPGSRPARSRSRG